MEYVGNATGIRRWRGQVTGCEYEFGAGKRLGYVDVRDGVKFIVPIRTGGAEAVFRVRDEDTGKKPEQV